MLIFIMTKNKFLASTSYVPFCAFIHPLYRTASEKFQRVHVAGILNSVTDLTYGRRHPPTIVSLHQSTSPGIAGRHVLFPFREQGHLKLNLPIPNTPLYSQELHIDIIQIHHPPLRDHTPFAPIIPYHHLPKHLTLNPLKLRYIRPTHA
jgi:hypothetical protein